MSIKELREAVEAGALDGRFDPRLERALYSLGGMKAAYIAGDAYHGSLDSALALHKAVLPNWGWDVSNVGAAELDCYRTGTKVETVSFIDNTARAWLIAILKALEVQEAEK